MLKSPYSGMAVMNFGVISENMSIFQIFHFECTIKI